jgi:hypothetical protein
MSSIPMEKANTAQLALEGKWKVLILLAASILLAIGPAIGILAMYRLRKLPASIKMAGGNK